MKPQATRTLKQVDDVERLKREGKTDAAIGTALQLSRGRVSQLHRVLQLPGRVVAAIRAGLLTVTHGVVLSGLRPADATGFAEIAIAKRWSVGQLREAINKKERGVSLRDVAAASDPNVRALESDLGERLGTQVAVQSVPEGQGGWLMVRWYDHEQLDGLLERIR